jgi:ribosomal protein L19E
LAFFIAVAARIRKALSAERKARMRPQGCGRKRSGAAGMRSQESDEWKPNPLTPTRKLKVLRETVTPFSFSASVELFGGLKKI